MKLLKGLEKALYSPIAKNLLTVAIAMYFWDNINLTVGVMIAVIWHWAMKEE